MPDHLRDPPVNITTFVRSLKTHLFTVTSTLCALEVLPCNALDKSTYLLLTSLQCHTHISYFTSTVYTGLVKMDSKAVNSSAYVDWLLLEIAHHCALHWTLQTQDSTGCHFQNAKRQLRQANLSFSQHLGHALLFSAVCSTVHDNLDLLVGCTSSHHQPVMLTTEEKHTNKPTLTVSDMKTSASHDSTCETCRGLCPGGSHPPLQDPSISSLLYLPFNLLTCPEPDLQTVLAPF